MCLHDKMKNKSSELKLILDMIRERTCFKKVQHMMHVYDMIL
jgi:hypothetical protein